MGRGRRGKGKGREEGKRKEMGGTAPLANSWIRPGSSVLINKIVN